MTRWGMVVDLGRCVGCQTCTIACKMENGLPPSTQWRTVLDVESGEFPDVTRTFAPMTCMQCADPPCYDACPTTATRVREDGIVWIVDDICIGCGSCVVACPYQARHLVPTEEYYFGRPTPDEVLNYDRGRVGICTKCHFCYHKFDDAPAGVVPGENPSYTPACSASCIADAIQFGDLANPASNVSKLIAANPGATRMLEHLDTDPSVYYLNAPAIEDRPLRLQHTWHKLAVSNFFCGPAGVGLFVLGTLMGWLAGLPAPLLQFGGAAPLVAGIGLATPTPGHLAGLLGPLLALVGLLSVAAEAGRPLRGFNVFRNFRNSWMSRESVLAMIFISAALLDTLLVQNPFLQAAAALAGLGVVLAQGLILSKAKGVPAWSVPIMPAHFLASGLMLGGGALLLVTSAFSGRYALPGWLAPTVLALVLIDWVVWVRYLRSRSPSATFQRSVALLSQGGFSVAIVYLGHLAPVVLLVAALLTPALLVPAGVGAGAAILAGGLVARYGLIMKAAFLADLFENFGTAKTQPVARPSTLAA